MGAKYKVIFYEKHNYAENYAIELVNKEYNSIVSIQGLSKTSIGAKN